MAVIANSATSFDLKGVREDLSDIIYNIAPTETPFMMMIGRGSATNTKHEWQMDSLAAAANNEHVEGDDTDSVGYTAVVVTHRIFNQCQISRKDVIVSGTADAVSKAGRKTELAYQLAKLAKELKRDMEFILTGSRGASEQIIQRATATAGRTLGFEGWIGTSDLVPVVQNWLGGAGQTRITSTLSQPNNATAITDGTQRAFVESDLKTVINRCWQSGGNPSVLMTGPVNKQNLSAFTGNTTRFDRSEDMRLVTAIDVYVSDFGEHRVVPNRFSRDRTCLVIDPSYWSVDYLRGFRQEPLAKTGDAEKRQLLVEYCLRSSNENASGAVFDLTT
jgi:hypothetical protein